LVKVFLTDENEAYAITIQNDKKRFFKVNPKLLKLGELGFFEKAIVCASEISENELPIII